MNQQEILKKIGGIIAELTEQYAYIQASDSAFNELELELFMANANFLTDHIEILKKISGQQKQLAPPEPMPVITVEETQKARPQIQDYFSEEEHSLFVETAEPKSETFVLPEVTEQKPIEIPAKENVFEEAIILPEKTPEIAIEEVLEPTNASFTDLKSEEQESKFEPVKEVSVLAETEILTTAPPQQVFEIEPENPILMEPVPVEEKKIPVTEDVKPLTLNERIAAQKGMETAVVQAQSAKKATSDLQSLISLNDKLLFVKELFSGYNLAYSEAINILNRYSTFEQAESFLKLNYISKNNWKEKPAAADRFYEVLRKKYS